MFTINGCHFAANKTEAAGLGDSCHGYYRRNRGGVVLMDHDKNPCAFMVERRGGGPRFIVTAHRYKGRIRYMFGASEITMRWLNMEGLSYSERRETCENAA